MTCFLSPERQQKLREMLTSLGQTPEQINKYFSYLPDDLVKVDDEMLIHIKTVIHCKAIGVEHESVVGLAILATIMVEAKSRGLAETAFPKMLKATRDDLIRRGVTPPSETLQ